MFEWLKKNRRPRSGPDFRPIDSLAKAMDLAQAGQLHKMFLLPPEFGGEDIPQNWVLVPEWVVEQKRRVDNNVIRPLAEKGKISKYTATPQYQGKSFIPNAIKIEASDPSSFSMTVAIWGDALESDSR